jgi:glycerol uptake facilitator protein
MMPSEPSLERHATTNTQQSRDDDIMIQAPLTGEFAGTFVMILLGDGVIAVSRFKPSKVEGAVWIRHTSAWALAVVCGVSTASFFGSADAHLNPAITLALSVKTGDFTRCAAYCMAQVAGAFVAAITFWLSYFPSREITEISGAKCVAFCTEPASPSYGPNVLREVAATFALVSVAGTINSSRLLSLWTIAGLPPRVVGYVVRVVGLSLGSASGCVVNPARDFGPRLARIVLPIATKGPSDWAYAWVPIVGPVVGAILAGGFLRFIGA